MSVDKTVKSYSAKERICNEKELQDDLDNFIIELSHIKSQHKVFENQFLEKDKMKASLNQ
jgi:hypothetical protein